MPEKIEIKKEFIHKGLAHGRWFTFSFAEQMGHIGSEVYRAKNWQNKDQKYFQGAVDRALELFDLTIVDKRWKGKLQEVVRAKKDFCNAVLDSSECDSKFKNLQKYFDSFLVEANASIIKKLQHM
jgi:hypothetical protein